MKTRNLSPATLGVIALLFSFAAVVIWSDLRVSRTLSDGDGDPETLGGALNAAQFKGPRRVPFAAATDENAAGKTGSSSKSAAEVFLFEAGKTRPICRFFNACLTAEGRLVLPKSLEPHDDLFRSSGIRGGCDLYANHAADKRLRAPLYLLGDKHELPVRVRDEKADRVYEATEFSGDLFSTQLFKDFQKTPPMHIPHFAYQVMTWLFVQDVLLHTDHSDFQASDEKCLGDACSNATLLTSGLAPEFFLRKEMMDVLHEFTQDESSQHEFAWVASFLSKMKQTGFRFRHSPPEGTMTCHKSIVFTTNSMISMPPGSASPVSYFSRRNGIKQGGHEATKLRITILQRSSSKRVFSEIENIESLAKQIRLPSDWSPTVEVHTHVFDGPVSLDDQIRVMENTDILLTPHGAGLANVLFLKPGSAVIEVAPFAFCSGFGHFSTVAGLSHTMMFAKPDLKTLFACVQEREDAYGHKDGVKEEAALVRQTFEEMSGIYWSNPGASMQICDKSEFHNVVGKTDTGRRCTRDHQKLVINSNELARVLRESAAGIRNFRAKR